MPNSLPMQEGYYHAYEELKLITYKTWNYLNCSYYHAYEELKLC